MTTCDYLNFLSFFWGHYEKSLTIFIYFLLSVPVFLTEEGPSGIFVSIELILRQSPTVEPWLATNSQIHLAVSASRVLELEACAPTQIFVSQCALMCSREEAS